jgi:5-methylcytosine-specific restriction protein A
MTGRTVPTWTGSTPDAPIPPRVRVRVWERAEGRCQAGCGRKLFPPADRWECDHVVALANGGAHAESNLQVACQWCHRAKTSHDVAEKAAVARKIKKHIGARAKSRQPMPFGRRDRLKRKVNGDIVER